MSTMKSFITTLDLVMQDKVEPETVVEEDEIEETLTINEDGEIVDENWLTDKLKAAGDYIKTGYSDAKERKSKDPKHWSYKGPKVRREKVISIPDDDDEESVSSLMGGKYDESIEQIEEYVLECERLHEMKRLSGQVITEAPMTMQHFIVVADIIASIENPDLRIKMMDKFGTVFNEKYIPPNGNFDLAKFKTHITSKAQAQPAEEPQDLPDEGAADPDYRLGQLVHIKGKVQPDRIPYKEVDAWLAKHPDGGLAESAEKKIVEDWGSSDWHVAMEEMWDSLLKRHNGKVTPETMEQAAEEVIMMHGEQMGYDEDSHDDGVSQVISMFLNRQDGIKNSDMTGLANDTWKHSEKTKYM